MTSQPLAGYLPHGFGCSILYPAHKITVELEIGPASLGHEPSYVLRVSIAGGYHCFVRYLIAMPVEMGHRFAFYCSHAKQAVGSNRSTRNRFIAVALATRYRLQSPLHLARRLPQTAVTHNIVRITSVHLPIAETIGRWSASGNKLV